MRVETSTPAATMLKSPPIRKMRQGSIFTTTIRLVCVTCNTTWMKAIEEAARPQLEPMILGATTSLITPRSAVIEWLVLKLLVLDAGDYKSVLFSPTERTEFYENRIIPSVLGINLLRYEGAMWKGRYRKQAGCVFDRQDPNRSDANNVGILLFGFGHLLTFGFVSRNSPLDFTLSPETSISLWPNEAESLIWPPSHWIGDLGAGQLANSLESFLTNTPGIRRS